MLMYSNNVYHICPSCDTLMDFPCSTLVHCLYIICGQHDKFPEGRQTTFIGTNSVNDSPLVICTVRFEPLPGFCRSGFCVFDRSFPCRVSLLPLSRSLGNLIFTICHRNLAVPNSFIRHCSTFSHLRLLFCFHKTKGYTKKLKRAIAASDEAIAARNASISNSLKSNGTLFLLVEQVQLV